MEGEEVSDSGNAEKVVNFRLSTWIKKEVFEEFQKFAKEKAGNKYETAIQVLMEYYKIINSVNLLAEDIADLKSRIEKLEKNEVKRPKVLGGESNVEISSAGGKA